jgi:hypothetical protein
MELKLIPVGSAEHMWIQIQYLVGTLSNNNNVVISVLRSLILKESGCRVFIVYLFI